MASLIYSAICSLDLFIADESGNFDWAAPDEEVHSFVNDLERPVGTYLYGRRMYDVMKFWDGPAAVEDQPVPIQDYAQIWRAADKVVYSRTLTEASTSRTRIERDFDADAVRHMKAAADRDMSIGGAELAGEAIRAGLVDEIRLLLHPVLVGAGTRALPSGARVQLSLHEERRFAGGVVYLRYRVV